MLHLIFKPGACRLNVCTWFLKIIFMRICMRLCVCQSLGNKKLVVRFELCMIGQMILVSSQFQFKILSVNIMNGHGPSNEMHHQLHTKTTKIMLH